MAESTSFDRRTVLGVFVLTAILSFPFFQSHGEDKKVWQSGTIVEVNTHQATPAENSEVKQYDISFKVGNKIYVALYTLERGRAEPQYYVGIERPVLIEGSTLKFNDVLGKTYSLRILKTRDVSPQEPK